MTSSWTVTVKLTDGLGNRLFQVAAMLAYAERYGHAPIFVKSLILPMPHGDAEEPITAYFPSIPVHDELPAVTGSTILHRPDAFRYEPLLEVQGHVILEGWFQHVSYLPLRFPHIPQIVVPPLGGVLPLVDWGRAAFLHVRRGDYLHPACAHHNVDLTSYYALALSLYDEDTTIVVCSDDRAWCISELPTKFPAIARARWAFLEAASAASTLACMAACGRGGICANSTFSWWGAALGAAAQGTATAFWCMPGTWGRPPLPPVVELYPAWATVLPVTAT
jgi:hypothetical protein